MYSSEESVKVVHCQFVAYSPHCILCTRGPHWWMYEGVAITQCECCIIPQTAQKMFGTLCLKLWTVFVLSFLMLFWVTEWPQLEFYIPCTFRCFPWSIDPCTLNREIWLPVTLTSGHKIYTDNRYWLNLLHIVYILWYSSESPHFHSSFLSLLFWGTLEESLPS